MNENLNNPEIKKSSIIFLIIMIAFFICNYFIIKINNDNLKRSFTNVLGSVTARVVEIDPKLEKEIVPLMTREINKEEQARGREILRQYGLSETLNTDLFPYIKDSFNNSLLGIFLMSISLTALLLILNCVQYGYFYKNIRDFSSAANRIVEGDYSLKLSEEREGDLSKLTKSFNSMGQVIRENISALQTEKSFLVNLLSDISHQLKTPLSTLFLYNDIMLSKDLQKDQRETFLKNNLNVLERMNWLILNLLKLAKIDANAIELQIEEQCLNETILETIDTLESKASEAEVKLNFIEKGKIYFSYDSHWLQEALINVVKNGIEHTDKGGCVTIELEENPVYTRIVVKDTGQGISEEDLANIFKRFYKGKKSKKSDSIGIGLSLAKSIIERHGGYIEASSKLDEGTSFTITFLKY